MKLPRDLIPVHEALRVGTIAAILEPVAEHFRIERTTLVEQLFSKR